MVHHTLWVLLSDDDLVLFAQLCCNCSGIFLRWLRPRLQSTFQNQSLPAKMSKYGVVQPLGPANVYFGQQFDGRAARVIEILVTRRLRDDANDVRPMTRSNLPTISAKSCFSSRLIIAYYYLYVEAGGFVGSEGNPPTNHFIWAGAESLQLRRFGARRVIENFARWIFNLWRWFSGNGLKLWQAMFWS